MDGCTHSGKACCRLLSRSFRLLQRSVATVQAAWHSSFLCPTLPAWFESPDMHRKKREKIHSILWLTSDRRNHHCLCKLSHLSWAAHAPRKEQQRNANYWFFWNNFYRLLEWILWAIKYNRQSLWNRVSVPKDISALAELCSFADGFAEKMNYCCYS